MPTPQETYETAVATLGRQFREQLIASSRTAGTTPDTLLKAVVSELLGEEDRHDGRARIWRVRLRLYDYATGLIEPVADSDEGLEPHMPGETQIRGLAGVVDWIRELACNFHGVACTGLDKRALRGKIGNLRTMMANRGDGTGVIRADYQVMVGETQRHMLARCDVQKVDESPSCEPKHLRRV